MKYKSTVGVVLAIGCFLGAFFAADLGFAKEVTLSFSIIHPADSPRAVPFSEIIEKFGAKNPDIKIEFSAGATGYHDMIKATITGGQPPDFFGITRWMMHDLGKEVFVEMTDLWQKHGWDKKVPGLVKIWAQFPDGKWYGVPGHDGCVEEWFYNKVMFANAGAGEPRTKEELLDVLRKLKASGVKYPWIVGAKDSWCPVFNLAAITAQTAGKAPIDKAREAADYNIPGLVEAIKIYKEIIDTGAIHPDMAGVGEPGSMSMMARQDGTILSIISMLGLDIMKVAGEDWKNISVFKEPVKFVDDPVTLYSASAGFIYVSTKYNKHLDETYKFIEFLLSPESQETLAKYGNLTGFPEINLKHITDPTFNLVAKHYATCTEDSLFLMDNLPAPVNTGLGTALKKMIFGTGTVEDAIEAMNEAAW